MPKIPPRALLKPLLASLREGLLHPFLSLAQADSTLQLEFRGTGINLYYRGGSLCQVSSQGNSFTASFDPRYFGEGPAITLPNKLTGSQQVTEWLHAVPHLKHTMDLWLGKAEKLERQYQQLFVLENNRAGGDSGAANASDFFVLDIEYSEPGGGRFDVVAVEWPSTSQQRTQPGFSPRLALLELKFGDGALTGDSGLTKHIDDVDRFCAPGETWEAFRADMLAVLQQKRALGLIPGLKAGSPGPTALSGEKPLFGFVLIAHDPEKGKLAELLGALPAMEHADLRFGVANFFGFSLFSQNLLSPAEFLSRFSAQIYSRSAAKV